MTNSNYIDDQLNDDDIVENELETEKIKRPEDGERLKLTQMENNDYSMDERVVQCCSLKNLKGILPILNRNKNSKNYNKQIFLTTINRALLKNNYLEVYRCNTEFTNNNKLLIKNDERMYDLAHLLFKISDLLLKISEYEKKNYVKESDLRKMLNIVKTEIMKSFLKGKTNFFTMNKIIIRLKYLDDYINQMCECLNSDVEEEKEKEKGGNRFRNQIEGANFSRTIQKRNKEKDKNFQIKTIKKQFDKNLRNKTINKKETKIIKKNRKEKENSLENASIFSIPKVPPNSIDDEFNSKILLKAACNDSFAPSLVRHLKGINKSPHNNFSDNKKKKRNYNSTITNDYNFSQTIKQSKNRNKKVVNSKIQKTNQYSQTDRVATNDFCTATYDCVYSMSSNSLENSKNDKFQSENKIRSNYSLPKLNPERWIEIDGTVGSVELPISKINKQMSAQKLKHTDEDLAENENVQTAKDAILTENSDYQIVSMNILYSKTHVRYIVPHWMDIDYNIDQTPKVLCKQDLNDGMALTSYKADQDGTIHFTLVFSSDELSNLDKIDPATSQLISKLQEIRGIWAESARILYTTLIREYEEQSVSLDYQPFFNDQKMDNPNLCQDSSALCAPPHQDPDTSHIYI